MRLALNATLLLTLLLLPGHLAHAGTPEAQNAPLAPVDTSSPRATLQSFRSNVEQAYQSWRRREGVARTENLVRRALRTLDLSQFGAALRSEVGIDNALYLYDTISRIGIPPLETIPDATEVAAREITRWTLPETEITIERIAEGPRAGEFLFSSDTVNRAPRFFSVVQPMPLPSGTPRMVTARRVSAGQLMPDALARAVWELPPAAFVLVFNQPIWKWVATLVSVSIACAAVWLMWRLGGKWDRRCRERERGGRIGRPLALIGSIGVVALGIWIDDGILLHDLVSLLISAVLTLLAYALVAWLVAELIARLGNLVIAAFVSTARSLDAALIRLCFRILSIAGALGVALYAASELGWSITPIIAGLGVGGLAVALAIRPTLENMVGGFVLFADKPVRVGEFCGFGDKLGTVEEIGLRSTRLRGLDRTVITVPNADFARCKSSTIRAGT